MTSLVNAIYYLSLLLVMLSVVFCFIRMLRGPALSDRVIALDLTANLLISIIAIISILTDISVYIDVVIALALIVFLTSVAFAKLIGSHYPKKPTNIRNKNDK